MALPLFGTSRLTGSAINGSFAVVDLDVRSTTTDLAIKSSSISSLILIDSVIALFLQSTQFLQLIHRYDTSVPADSAASNLSAFRALNDCPSVRML